MPLEIFGEFGLVGGEDSTANPNQDRQTLINWYVEVAVSKSAKVPAALLGTPGLIGLVSTTGFSQSSVWTADSSQVTADSWSTADGAYIATIWPQPSSIKNVPVRGVWVLPGRTQALAVIGNICYLVQITSLGSSITPGVLTLTKVGTLRTTAGPVCIRDNGLGGTAVLVDGPNGYYYTIASRAFTPITDPAWLGSNTVAFVDGWWIFNEPGTQTFYTNAQPYSLAFNASYFANKDAFSDRLMGVIESKEELWLVGEETTEIWYDAGGQYFPFQRLVGTMLQVGCKSWASIARFSADQQDGLIWFGRSDRGENIVVRTIGFAYEVVSTPAISNAIAEYTVTSDAIGYTYQEDGHEFYVLTFPTADRTWVFDATVPLEFAWHQRLSYDPYADQYHRHRSNCYMNFAGMRIVGDYQNGTLYQMTRSSYTDAGWPILAKRRAPHVWDKGPRSRIFMASLQIDVAAGQGTPTGLGQMPLMTFRNSKDGGATFGQKWPASMGAIGQTSNRCMWRRLGFARDNVCEIETIAPVNRDIAGATLHALAPAAQQ
jgi:hypothetical protein